MLKQKNIEVLFDDRSGITAGEKFADADLLGMPYRIVVSARSIEAGGVELKKRIEDKSEIVKIEDLVNKLVAKD